MIVLTFIFYIFFKTLIMYYMIIEGYKIDTIRINMIVGALH
jgi:hypothetical protein